MQPDNKVEKKTKKKQTKREPKKKSSRTREKALLARRAASGVSHRAARAAEEGARHRGITIIICTYISMHMRDELPMETATRHTCTPFACERPHILA